MAVSLVPEAYTKWASCVCMAFFGIKMLKEGFGMPVEDREDQSLIALDQSISGEVFDSQNNILQYNEISSNHGEKCSNSKGACTKVKNHMYFKLLDFNLT